MSNHAELVERLYQAGQLVDSHSIFFEAADAIKELSGQAPGQAMLVATLEKQMIELRGERDENWTNLQCALSEIDRLKALVRVAREVA